MPLDQQSILARAKQHLADADEEHLRYAALECRLLMEELTYEKLRAYSDLLPEEELNRWQPREAVKMLLAIDPVSDQHFTIEIAADDLPADWKLTKEGVEGLSWMHLGNHYALSHKWLKNYHRISRLLHAPKASETTVMPIVDQVKLLTEVVSELEKAANSTIRSMVCQGGLAFTCEGCGRRILASAMSPRAGATFLCPNDDCQFEYASVAQSNAETSPPVTSLAKLFKCPVCHATKKLARRKLSQGYTFRCVGCSTDFRLAEPEWKALKA